MSEVSLLNSRIKQLEDEIARLHGLEGELERSLRDQFAAAALTGILSNSNIQFPQNADGSITNAAFDIAEDMIIERRERNSADS